MIIIVRLLLLLLLVVVVVVNKISDQFDYITVWSTEIDLSHVSCKG